MQINKFLGVLALGASMQIKCMEQERVQVTDGTREAATTSADNTMVSCVLLQVRPGYVTGTNLVRPISGIQAAKHEQALSSLCSICKARSLNPVPNLGIYVLSFKEPVLIDKVQALCAKMPGFENLYAVEADEAKTLEVKQNIAALRLDQFAAHVKRSKSNAAKLVAFKSLSTSQMMFKEKTVLNAKAVSAK
ncbi:MAG: hypothetical protein AB7F19_02480 [Candidatus Babeliales bacterium]